MPLRRETVVDAALELLDEVGLDALTTRALTGRLGVRPGALYWHVRDKRELLTAVAERIMDEVFAPATAPTAPPAGTPTPAPAATPAAATPALATPADGTCAAATPADGTPAPATPADGTPAPATPAADTPATDSGPADDWIADVTVFAHALRSALLRHRDGARLVATHTPVSPVALRAVEEGLARMRAAGVPLELAAHFGDTVTSYVTGFALQEQAAPGGAAAGPAPDAAAYPHLTAWAGLHTTPDRDAAFRTGIALITGGLRVALEGGSGQV
ncbi:TetR/AcrR family transcriptional regulator C-terminal domain-containing protein [Streptantibioticus silvisoli]|uniref:TetR/AcrR family transcriptional regulator C-terminal domain-containing protein n=1 Tax=Streptantibioticus silvisoli TaxID=2705255 RepID=A0ABT6W8X0_9ACTN|nr:TetR/AcrR family transcriptional regulator C-terminal domain-containing protein [Streptantibioticus silvisoli]MDI5967207.1 TetR/AcrR family transcriptional regulator C-terminal domain-containing protein [Streptantibioticus silvisoli]